MFSFGCFVPVKRSSLQWPVMCGTESTAVIIAMWRAGEMACGKDRLRGEETWILGNDDVSTWSVVSWWCPSKTDQCQPVFDTSRPSDISCCKTLLWLDYCSLLTYLSMLWVRKVEVLSPYIKTFCQEPSGARISKSGSQFIRRLWKITVCYDLMKKMLNKGDVWWRVRSGSFDS